MGTDHTLDTLYSRIRAEAREDQQTRILDAYARAPELLQIDEARTRLFAQVGSRAIPAEEGMRELKRLAAREAALLETLSLPQDALKLRYRCARCKDTGYIGSSPRRPCPCRLQYRELQKPGADINDKETFSSFSETIFADETQRKRTLNAKKRCERYAAELPHPELPNLLIMGMPGLGKSFLGNAIAFAAISAGVETTRLTAYRFVQDMLSDIREHTSHAKRYCAVPLLVLDDLGSEPDVPNVSTEWLFAVVNERVLQRRATVCITNLTLRELQARYGERVMSRLCDRATTTALQLTGENLRTARP